jgi:hypothetical protein
MRTGKLWLLRLSGLAVFIAFSSSLAAQDPSPFRWDNIPRVVTIGDVHGSYEKLLKLLRGTALVNEELNWTGGEIHNRLIPLEIQN